jgi:hypothetical protein
MTERIQRLNLVVLIIVVLYTISIERILLNAQVTSPVVTALFTFLTSVGFYRILLEIVFFLIGNLEFFLRIYWGKIYVNGLWSYSYTLEGHDVTDKTVYIGIWRFEQNLYETKVVGFGLTNEFVPRSRVRSVTDMICYNGAYEFVNMRNDSIDALNEFYSRTTMFFELSKNRFFRYPIRMRGKTIMYGGPLSGRVCNNVFIRHESARTEEDVIEELKRIYLTESVKIVRSEPVSGDNKKQLLQDV